MPLLRECSAKQRQQKHRHTEQGEQHYTNRHYRNGDNDILCYLLHNLLLFFLFMQKL